MSLTRRKFLGFLLPVILMSGSTAYAQEKESEGGDKGGGGDRGGNDDGGNDDGGGGGGGNNNSPGGSSGGSGGQVSGDSPAKQKIKKFLNAPIATPQQAREAVQGGQAASMPLLLSYLKEKYPGQVLDIKLRDNSTNFVYEVRYLSDIIFLRTVFLDARTLQKL
jgi:hypothetical protein